MSFGSGPNPFQSMAAAKPRKPSPIPKIIAVVVTLVVLLIVGLIFLPKIKYIGGGLSHGLYSKEDAIKVSDKELWGYFNDDEEMAIKKYKGRWVVVSGECSEVNSFRPDGSAINEQYAVQVGRAGTRLSLEWMVDCNIPPARVKEFQSVREGGILTVRGKCKGKNMSNQVELTDCEFVGFSAR